LNDQERSRKTNNSSGMCCLLKEVNSFSICGKQRAIQARSNNEISTLSAPLSNAREKSEEETEKLETGPIQDEDQSALVFAVWASYISLTQST
jgi:hypothetical protein